MSYVLIVEDDRDLRDMMVFLLQCHSYPARTAANGREALERLREARASLVILDINMPIMSGWEFREQQLADPTIADIPVICLTAQHDPMAVARRTRTRCFRKPADLDVVMREVVGVCGPPSSLGGG
jgi:two-component system chemotaxis response regulator CheY